MNVKHVTMLEYKHLFGEFKGDKHAEVLSLIRGVNFVTAFRIVARLNYIVRKNELKNFKDEVIFWFGSNSPSVKEYLARIATGYPKSEHGSLHLLNIWSNLSLLQRFLETYQVLQSHSKESTLEDDTHERLFKAYLLINEIYVARFNSQKVLESIPNGAGPVLKVGLTMAAMLLPYHDLNHVDAADAMACQFIKAVYFFQFAETHLPKALEEFLKSYGVSTWREYFKAIFPIVGHALQSNKEGLGYLTIDNDNPEANASRKFLSNLSIASNDQGFNQHDFILPRSKPLMQINSDKYLIIDNLLIYNKMYNSLFFEFKQVIEKHPNCFTKEDFKGYYNDHFSESFLTKQVLHSIFADSKYLRKSGDEIREAHGPKFKAEPDYYARKDSHLFLFELKDTLVNGVTKQSFNAQLIAKELKSKLWFKATEVRGKVKEEPKAIRQLQNNIRRAAINGLPFDKELENKQLTIYPILLYLDQSLSTPGINEIIQQWFAFELAHDCELGMVQNRFNIMPLTMIDLDTLILFQDEFKKGALRLEELIPRFWQYKQDLIMKGAQQKGFQGIYESNLSFGAFIRINREKRVVPTMFSNFGRLLFDKSSEA